MPLCMKLGLVFMLNNNSFLKITLRYHVTLLNCREVENRYWEISPTCFQMTLRFRHTFG